MQWTIKFKIINTWKHSRYLFDSNLHLLSQIEIVCVGGGGEGIEHMENRGMTKDYGL